MWPLKNLLGHACCDALADRQNLLDLAAHAEVQQALMRAVAERLIDLRQHDAAT